MSDSTLILLKEKIIHTDSVIKLLAEKNAKITQIREKLKFLHYKYLEKIKEVELYKFEREPLINLTNEHKNLLEKYQKLENTHHSFANEYTIKYQKVCLELEDNLAKNKKALVKSDKCIKCDEQFQKNSALKKEMTSLKQQIKKLSLREEKYLKLSEILESELELEEVKKRHAADIESVKLRLLDLENRETGLKSEITEYQNQVISLEASNVSLKEKNIKLKHKLVSTKKCVNNTVLKDVHTDNHDQRYLTNAISKTENRLDILENEIQTNAKNSIFKEDIGDASPNHPAIDNWFENNIETTVHENYRDHEYHLHNEPNVSDKKELEQDASVTIKGANINKDFITDVKQESQDLNKPQSLQDLLSECATLEPIKQTKTNVIQQVFSQQRCSTPKSNYTLNENLQVDLLSKKEEGNEIRNMFEDSKTEHSEDNSLEALNPDDSNDIKTEDNIDVWECLVEMKQYPQLLSPLRSDDTDDITLITPLINEERSTNFTIKDDSSKIIDISSRLQVKKLAQKRRRILISNIKKDLFKSLVKYIGKLITKPAPKASASKANTKPRKMSNKFKSMRKLQMLRWKEVRELWLSNTDSEQDTRSRKQTRKIRTKKYRENLELEKEYLETKEHYGKLCANFQNISEFYNNLSGGENLNVGQISNCDTPDESCLSSQDSGFGKSECENRNVKRLEEANIQKSVDIIKDRNDENCYENTNLKEMEKIKIEYSVDKVKDLNIGSDGAKVNLPMLLSEESDSHLNNDIHDSFINDILKLNESQLLKMFNDTVGIDNKNKETNSLEHHSSNQEGKKEDNMIENVAKLIIEKGEVFENQDIRLNKNNENIEETRIHCTEHQNLKQKISDDIIATTLIANNVEKPDRQKLDIKESVNKTPVVKVGEKPFEIVNEITAVPQDLGVKVTHNVDSFFVDQKCKAKLKIARLAKHEKCQQPRLLRSNFKNRGVKHIEHINTCDTNGSVHTGALNIEETSDIQLKSHNILTLERLRSLRSHSKATSRFPSKNSVKRNKNTVNSKSTSDTENENQQKSNQSITESILGMLQVDSNSKSTSDTENEKQQKSNESITESILGIPQVDTNTTSPELVEESSEVSVRTKKIRKAHSPKQKSVTLENKEKFTSTITTRSDTENEKQQKSTKSITESILGMLQVDSNTASPELVEESSERTKKIRTAHSPKQNAVTLENKEKFIGIITTRSGTKNERQQKSNKSITESILGMLQVNSNSKSISDTENEKQQKSNKSITESILGMLQVDSNSKSTSDTENEKQQKSNKSITKRILGIPQVDSNTTSPEFVEESSEVSVRTKKIGKAHSHKQKSVTLENKEKFTSIITTRSDTENEKQQKSSKSITESILGILQVDSNTASPELVEESSEVSERTRKIRKVHCPKQKAVTLENKEKFTSIITTRSGTENERHQKSNKAITESILGMLQVDNNSKSTSDTENEKQQKSNKLKTESMLGILQVDRNTTSLEVVEEPSEVSVRAKRIRKVHCPKQKAVTFENKEKFTSIITNRSDTENEKQQKSNKTKTESMLGMLQADSNTTSLELVEEPSEVSVRAKKIRKAHCPKQKAVTLENKEKSTSIMTTTSDTENEKQQKSNKSITESILGMLQVNSNTTSPELVEGSSAVSVRTKKIRKALFTKKKAVTLENKKEFTSIITTRSKRKLENNDDTTTTKKLRTTFNKHENKTEVKSKRTSRAQKRLNLKKNQKKVAVNYEMIKRTLSAEVDALKTPEKTVFKRPNRSKVQMQSPASPPPPDVMDCDEVPTVPKIIPLEPIGELCKGTAKELLNELIQFPEQSTVVQNVVEEFKSQEIEYIISLILEEISVDISAPDILYTPPAPVMTVIQRTLLGLCVKLEEIFPNLLTDIVLAIEGWILTKSTLQTIQPLTRFYIAICKLQKQTHRMRRMICDMFYILGDLSIPFLFTVLSTWVEILPLETESSENSLVTVLIQIINMKTCLKPGYNLTPLRKLLATYYGYPTERRIPEDVFKEIFEKFIVTPTRYIEYCLLILCKNHPNKWVCQQATIYLKPVLIGPSENKLYKPISSLMQNIALQLVNDKSTHAKEVRLWLKDSQ